MRQTSLKGDRVAELIDEITMRTGESKIQAVQRALEDRLEKIAAEPKGRLTLDWLRTSVWPRLGTSRGEAPTKEEQEELLGYP